MSATIEKSRTLVKSPPELWAELSEGELLARHLGAFEGIRITKLEPETAVAWEGELASGTVRLEPSGWGTRVVLTACSAAPDRAADAPQKTAPGDRPAEPEQPHESAPTAAALGRRPGRRPGGLVGRLLRLVLAAAGGSPPSPASPSRAPGPQSRAPAPGSRAPAPEPKPAPKPDPESHRAVDVEAVLVAALDRLGQAHHRPFSRS